MDKLAGYILNTIHNGTVFKKHSGSAGQGNNGVDFKFTNNLVHIMVKF